MHKNGVIRMLDLMRLVPATRRAVRLYETQGLLRPAGKDRHGRRLYLISDLARLRLIRDLRSAGLSVAAIRDLLDSRIPLSDDESSEAWMQRLETALQQHLAHIDAHLAEVRRVFTELHAAAAWLDRHRQALLADAEPAAGADVPELLRSLLDQPLSMSMSTTSPPQPPTAPGFEEDCHY